MNKIIELLQQNKDGQYADFQRKLLPTVDPEIIIGVRTPCLRNLAKTALSAEEKAEFYAQLPHQFFDENQLHCFLLSAETDFKQCIRLIERFLPFIDNWATCDQLSPRIFRSCRAELLPHIQKWLHSDRTYTLRFAVGMLMQHYLDDDFKPEYLKWVCDIPSDEYYVKMEIAWYLATALCKQWQATIPYIEGKYLPVWVHNKAIQKARESRRITPEQKAYLQTLKIK